MVIIAVDDEKISLEGIVSILKKTIPNAEVYGFRYPQEAIEFIKESNKCDVAFLDIEMYQLNGIKLAELLKSVNPNINIIFTTGYSDYLKDAFKIHASGYLMKPITSEMIISELNELRYPLLDNNKVLKVQCFGNFEVFADNKPVKFSRSKTKELFACLVDKCGNPVNTEQLCDILWEDTPNNSNTKKLFRTLVSDLRCTLKSINAEDVFISSRNNFAILPEKLDCDYYLFCNDKDSIKKPNEYMSQYSWAEERLASIITDS